MFLADQQQALNSYIRQLVDARRGEDYAREESTLNRMRHLQAHVNESIKCQRRSLKMPNINSVMLHNKKGDSHLLLRWLELEPFYTREITSKQHAHPKFSLFYLVYVELHSEGQKEMRAPSYKWSNLGDSSLRSTRHIN
uniref:Uncharacterized protein n=1 Tax=Arundo donax TaxID=35708 RepID=A0A0A9AJW4_ARUDO